MRLFLTVYCVASSSLAAAAAIMIQQNTTPRRAAIARIICVSTLACPPALALTPSTASERYDKYAATYNQLDGGVVATTWLGLAKARDDLISKATGNVLEIGVGTGLNLEYYNVQQLTSLKLVDISTNMLQEARDRIQNDVTQLSTIASLTQADATSELVSRFGRDSFDTVVDTFSLCVLGNVGAVDCIRQLATVVKPQSGRILLLENTRSSNAILGAYQDVTADAAAEMGGKGCVYNQDVRQLIKQSNSNLVIEKETMYAAGIFRAFECRKIA